MTTTTPAKRPMKDAAMMRRLGALIDYQVHSNGGVAGTLADFQFSDFDWFVVNLVVDPAQGTAGPPLVVPVLAAEEPDTDHRILRIDTSRKQPERAPRVLDDLNDDAGAAKLVSFKQLLGYSVSVSDGPVGRVADLLLEADAWKIASMVAEIADPPSTRRKVLIPRLAMRAIDEPARTVNVELTRDDVAKCPPIDATAGVQSR